MAQFPPTGLAPEGHPIHTLMTEHRRMLDFAAGLIETAVEIKNSPVSADTEALAARLEHFVKHFRSAQKHYLREENVLFPLLEKRGVTGPPAQMWAEHDKIRELEREIFAWCDAFKTEDIQAFGARLLTLSEQLQQLLTMHYHKEDTILFPMALKVLAPHQWPEVSQQFAEIGYCCFTPPSAYPSPATLAVQIPPSAPAVVEGLLDFGSGKLNLTQVKAMLNHLPFEITFVDKNDVFSYFNKVAEPIFLRTNASLGNQVQRCHPQKSVHLVNQILADFKSGAKKVVEFWIHMGDKYVYIRYFALHDEKGEYIGCMEVTQDVKDLQEITGEKRLM